MRLVDAFLTFPPLLLAVALVGLLGPDIQNVMLALGLVQAPVLARIVRGSTLAVREDVYVTAARALGAGPTRIVLSHILRNMMSPIVVQLTIVFSAAVVAEASLSFLGFGTQPPQPSWGRDMSEARRFLGDAPWMFMAPTGDHHALRAQHQLLGDGLRDALDPRAWRTRRRLAAGEGVMPLLSVRNLQTRFATDRGIVRAVNGVSFDLEEGEVLGLVGESGSGKSVTALSIMRLVPEPPGQVTADCLTLRRHRSAAAERSRGARDPRLAHGHDLPGPDALAQSGADHRPADHRGAAPPREARSGSAARRRAIELLETVGIPMAEKRLGRLSAPVLGRHAPARDDRHRALLQSAAADRRRGHDGARRHHPGADHRPGEAPARASAARR